MMRSCVAILVLCLCGNALAQTSSSYRLEEFAVNGGGHPSGGELLQSSSFRMSVDSVGDGPLGPGLLSSSNSMDLGFGRSYQPPREVQRLVVHPDKQTFAWDPDESVGEYLVYRGALDPGSGGFGTCRMSDLPTHTAFLDDFPETGHGFFYIIIARNRLGEDGSPGLGSDNVPREPMLPCP